MHKLKTALTALVGNTSERTAAIAAIVIKAACIVPAGCTAITVGAGWLGMSPDQFAGALITYMMLRFASKAQKA